MINELKDYERVHIVFGDSIRGSLKMALKDMRKGQTDKIISFSDIFSIGPVWKLNDYIGLKKRYDWLENHLIYEKDEEIERGLKRFKDTLVEIDSIPISMPITIWAGENSHEQTGLRFVLNLLKEKSNKIYYINSNLAYELLYKSKKIDYQLLYTGELTPEKLKGLYENNYCKDLLSSEERRQLAKEWETLSNTQEVLRVWGDSKIQSVDDNYYDDYIINKAQYLHNDQGIKKFMKSARLIGEVIGHLQQYHGDAFFEYRVRQLIMNGVFEIQGVPKTMRFYSVKLR